VTDPRGRTPAAVLSHLHHVQLAMPAGHEDEARRFFVGVLGMAEIEKPPVLATRGGAWFRGGGVEIHLGVEDPFPRRARRTRASSSSTSTTPPAGWRRRVRASRGTPTSRVPPLLRPRPNDRLEFLEPVVARRGVS
jgi:catechol 2,3-dioxygenase-like lactoylglutathione lyase family enzyme